MKILLAGEGGQGVQVIAEILAKAAFIEGKKALYIPNFGVEQRGGVSLAFVVVETKPVVYPKFEKADFLGILSERSIPRVKQYIDKKTKVVLSPAVTGEKMPEVSRMSHLRGVPGMTPRVWNMLVLGKVNSLGKIVSPQSLIKAMDERFAKQFEKNPELRKFDLEALKAGAN